MNSSNARYWRGRGLGARVAVARDRGRGRHGQRRSLGVLLSAVAKARAAGRLVSTRLASPTRRPTKAANPHANIKWVIYNGNANGTGVLQSKFALWNRTGWPSDAPDVMFDTQNYDAVQLGTAPYNDLLNLKNYVPKSVLNNFATAPLCRVHDAERPGNLPAQ